MDPSRLDGGLFDPAGDDAVDLDALAERGDLDAALKSDLWAEQEEEGDKTSMMQFLATDGGRKCPLCGRYAKPGELGNLSHTFYDPTGKWQGRLSRYGHLPGHGCNTHRGQQ